MRIRTARSLLLATLPAVTLEVAAAQAPASGTQTPATGAPAAPRDTAAPCPPPPPAASVITAYNVRQVSADSFVVSDTTNKRVKLRDVIALRIRNLSHLRAQAACAARDGRARKIVLYLDGRPVPDLVAYPPTDPDSALLMFPLQRTETSRDVWTHILGKPRFRARPVAVSVGVEDRFAIPSQSVLQFEILPLGYLLAWAVLLLLVGLAFFWLARASDVLRDRAAAWSIVKRPYSLATMQAAWWFFVALASYVFIGLVTGDYSTSITGTVLVLLGISAAAKIGGAIVDVRNDTPEEAAKEADVIGKTEVKLKETNAKLAPLKQAVDGGNATPAQKHEYAQQLSLQGILESRLRKLRNESESFLRDLVSDGNGVNFHRFQMATWTLVLSVVFIVEVYRELAMPQFSDTLLGLMGISAGTYVGLKAAEPTVPSPPPKP